MERVVAMQVSRKCRAGYMYRKHRSRATFIAMVGVVLGAIWGQAQSVVLGAAGKPWPPAGEFSIDAAYPGGNIVVERIEGNTVYLRHDLRDTDGWWFYWNFRAKAAAERTLRFQFIDKNPIGTNGPAVSTNCGKSWLWLGTDRVKDSSFSYTFAENASEVRFCFAVPYQESDLQNLLARFQNSPNLAVGELCRTRKGRSVERVHVGRIEGRPKYRDHDVWFTIEADFLGNGTWKAYAPFRVPAKGYIHHEFPDGFSAHWVRESVDRDCIATVYFMYN